MLGTLLVAFLVFVRVRPFEWMLAQRYLRLLQERSPRIHVLTALLATLWLLLWGAVVRARPRALAALAGVAREWNGLVEKVRLVTIVLTVAVEVFLRFVRRFTVFSTISTYGLFLGTGALVIVLSVMSGFETDLRHKILGINAHITVTRPEQPFTDYREARAKLAKLPGVIGVTPYISNEVMISSQSNLSGVVVKGIDPETDGQVTDLEKDVDLGDLKLLNQPDKLRTLGGPPILRRDDDDDLMPSPGAAAIHFAGRRAPTGAAVGCRPLGRKPIPGVVHRPTSWPRTCACTWATT